MATFISEPDQVIVPKWVTDLASFRQWTDGEDFPETGRICYLNGEVWVDMSKEQLFTHLTVKNEFNIVLGSLVKSQQSGLYFPDGARLSNVDADIAVVPDALFTSHDALEDRVRMLEGREEGFVELEGSPNMVLEVVSSGSVDKDTRVLRRDYWQAGIREYWLVDARPDPLVFDILRYTPKGYRATPKKESWVASAVFGKSFRLTRCLSQRGHPEYTLEVR